LVLVAFVFSWVVAKTSERFTSETTQLLLAISVFALPALIGWVIKFLMEDSDLTEEEVLKIQKESELREPIEFVQHIDNILNCVIGVNNVWIQKNWSSLEDTQKVEFISKNRAIFNKELVFIEDAVQMIELLQRIHRGLTTESHIAS